MHLLLTDALVCPRCGPTFGLILLAEELRDRRVVEGGLGCANCRERYPVEGGFADLRPPPRPPVEATPPLRGDDPEEALRIAALLGLVGQGGRILLTGESVGQASRLAAMLDEVEVVALHPGLRGVGEEPGVSRINAGEKLPFFDGSLRGIALEGDPSAGQLAEAVRTLVPGGRLLVRAPSEGGAAALDEAGLELLLETAGVLVASRSG